MTFFKTTSFVKSDVSILKAVHMKPVLFKTKTYKQLSSHNKGDLIRRSTDIVEKKLFFYYF